MPICDVFPVLTSEISLYLYHHADVVKSALTQDYNMFTLAVVLQLESHQSLHQFIFTRCMVRYGKLFMATVSRLDL